MGISTRSYSRFVPRSIKGRLKSWVSKRSFDRLEGQRCDVRNLRLMDEGELRKMLEPKQFETEWKSVVESFAGFNIPDGTGGVNPGDRRAIYYLIRAIKPKSVLEIGTHIGASTIHIAAALRNCQREDGEAHRLVTVDIKDVNSPIEKPWGQYGMSYSPRQMVDALQLGDTVSFQTSTSLAFAASSSTKFDFIFLDGDHSAKAVYQEVPAALNLLAEGGVILLHDYFPGNMPLWSNNNVIEGPCMAIERFRTEGVNFRVLPLGALPWPTKLDSNVTSLAVLVRG